MRINVGAVFKATGLLALCVCTHFVTKEIYGQRTRARPATPRGTVVEVGQAARAAAADPTAVPVLSLTHYRVESCSIRGAQGALQVLAAVTFYDLRPDYRFFWALRVTPEGEKGPVYSKRYTEQEFVYQAENEDGTMPAAFAESLRLLPGHYRVRLTLHAFPRTLDPSILDDDKKALPYCGVSRAQKITIPG